MSELIEDVRLRLRSGAAQSGKMLDNIRDECIHYAEHAIKLNNALEDIRKLDEQDNGTHSARELYEKAQDIAKAAIIEMEL